MKSFLLKFIFIFFNLFLFLWFSFWNSWSDLNLNKSNNKDNWIIKEIWKKFYKKFWFWYKKLIYRDWWTNYFVSINDPLYLFSQVRELKNIVEQINKWEKLNWYLSKIYWFNLNEVWKENLVYKNLSWPFVIINKDFFVKEIKIILKLLKLVWNEKKYNLIINFIKNNKNTIDFLFEAWVMWAINQAENPIIDSNNLNPAWNWWFFQVIYWCSNKWLYWKYRIIDRDFLSLTKNEPFIYKIYFDKWFNGWTSNATKQCFIEEWYKDISNQKINLSFAIKIWKLISKIYDSDYLFLYNL